MKWENYQLKDIANYWSGKVEASVLDATNYISTENLIPDRGGVVNSNYVPTSGNSNSYSENDVLISNIRPYFKKIWFADKQGGCSNDVLVFRAKENIEPLFLYYQLSKDAFFDDMVAGSNGTKMPRGNKTSIMEFKLQIPPLPTQRKIASILSAYDDLIENNLKRIKLLEKKAFLRYKGIVKSEKMEEYFIADVCETLGGGTPSTGNLEFWNEGEILWFSPTDLTKHNSIVLLDSEKKITELGLQKSSAKLLPPKTILMTSRASIGYFGLINKAVSTNQGFINIIPFKEYHRAYLLFDLKNRKEEIIGNANGSTFLEISKGKFRQMKVKLPKNETVLFEFEKEFELLFNLIENLLKQNAKLREARDILLPRLMSGEVEV
jgi:type I restriction enzyme S subunit